MSKRGQITVFIIIGLVIVITVAVFYFVGSQEAKSYMPSVLDAKEINQEQQLIQSCVDKETKEALVLLGSSGSLNSSEYIDTPEGKVALLYTPQSGHSLPSVQELLAQVSEASNNMISSCLIQVHSDSPDLPLSDYVLYPGEDGIGAFSVIAMHLQGKISFIADSSIRFKTYDSEFTPGRFSSSADIDLEHIHAIAEAILKQLSEDKGLLDSELLLSLEDQGVDIEIYPTDDSTLIKITDLTHKLAGNPYAFQFAVQLADNPAVELGE